MNLESYLRGKRGLVDDAIDRHLPSAGTPPRIIHEAMRYAVLGGGKRIRPILAIAAAEACGADPAPLMRAFAALELIHTYSLVHDDLPALDDDDLRRGRRTTHVVYGEAMAILTGDALLTEAFAWLATPLDGVDASRQLRANAVVARAVDSRGMIGGQVADLEATGSGQWPGASGQPDLETGSAAPQGRSDVIPRNSDGETRVTGHWPPTAIEHSDGIRPLDALLFIHENKTGKLLTASALLGGILGGASEDEIGALERFGRATGLAFQIVDDLLDIEGDAATLGKTAGKDAAQGKLTWPALVGVDEAREEARRQLGIALDNAGMIRGPANYLGEIARYVCDRRS